MAAFEVGSFTLGSLLGIVLGAFIGHRLAIRRNNQQTLNTAAIEFKKAFLYAQQLLDDNNPGHGVISMEFPKHDTAMRKYQMYLTGFKRKAFDNSWLKYKEWHSVICNRDTAEVMYGANDPTYVAMKDIKINDLLNNLLAHAEIK